MAKGTVDLAAESRSPAPNSVTHSRLSVAAMGRIPETPPGGADGVDLAASGRSPPKSHD
jgi:hypothetical protein